KQNNPQQAIPKKHTIQTHKEPKQSLKTSTHYQVLKHHTHTPKEPAISEFPPRGRTLNLPDLNRQVNYLATIRSNSLRIFGT
ncbi:hypothetical protein, partial [Changpingibacter yushuensis]|uniref:hypothetical protein n=1 Tax=Changpingibacter yushuensis TaxID=2758440 RepID=UPI001CB6F093